MHISICTGRIEQSWERKNSSYLPSISRLLELASQLPSKGRNTYFVIAKHGDIRVSSFGRQSAVALPCKAKQTKATITLRFFLLCHAKANRRKRHCRLRLFTLVRQWEGNEFCSRFFADVSSLVPSGVTVSRKIIQYSVFPFEFGVAQGPKLQFRYVVLCIRLVCE